MSPKGACVLLLDDSLILRASGSLPLTVFVFPMFPFPIRCISSDILRAQDAEVRDRSDLVHHRIRFVLCQRQHGLHLRDGLQGDAGPAGRDRPLRLRHAPDERRLSVAAC